MPKPPSFVELYGIPETAILTRVERQMSAQETKDVHFGQIRTLRLLREHTQEFNPFARLIFADAGKPEPNPVDYSPLVYMAGMHFRGRIQRDGYAAAVRWLSQYANGNLKRLLMSLATPKFPFRAKQVRMPVAVEKVSFGKSIGAWLISSALRISCSSLLFHAVTAAASVGFRLRNRTNHLRFWTVAAK
jgi:hypothetical protein